MNFMNQLQEMQITTSNANTDQISVSAPSTTIREFYGGHQDMQSHPYSAMHTHHQYLQQKQVTVPTSFASGGL